MKRLATLAFAILMAFVMAGCAATNNLTPLPKTLNVVTPDPSVGKLAECSGTWLGNWDNRFLQATTIVLEKINQAEVIAIYSYGATGGYPGDWIRVAGKITNASTIILEWGDVRRTVTLIFIEGKLHAEYRRGAQVNRAILTKVPDLKPSPP